jgi:ABC-type multidrug transport system ATPase subunit
MWAVILDHGRLIATGSMSELRRSMRSSSSATLEDLFLQLTGGQDVAEMIAHLGEAEEARA